MSAAVIDIGSNTVVLAVFDYEDGNLSRKCYESQPVRLASYINDGHMAHEGMVKAADVIEMYKNTCRQLAVTKIKGAVTEPWRHIDNVDEFKRTLKKTGIDITYLTGEEEAACDFYGASLEKKVQPLLIDIGGGSTEFVAGKGGRIIDAVSLPLGCVRLCELPLSPEISGPFLKEMRGEHPALPDTAVATGVGGTIRAVRLVCDALHHTGYDIHTEHLRWLYKAMLDKDEKIMRTVSSCVDAKRKEVMPAGMGMLVAATECFQIEKIETCENGLREGFYMRFMCGA